MIKEINNTDNQTDISQIGNVDQIREILFGSQTRELNQRFEKIEKEIKSVGNEVRAKIEQNYNDTNIRIDNEIEALSKKLKNVISQQQNEFADVRDSSLKQEKRLQKSIEIMEEELNAKREQLQKMQTENRDMLRSEMNTLKSEVLNSLSESASQLDEVKLSRDDAAEIMMEAAMRMKGTLLEQQLTQIDSGK